MPVARWPTGVLAAGFVLLVAATLWGLDRYARHEFTVHLRERAAFGLALAATGGSPYQWRFRGADDIVAGHPFGTTQFDLGDDGLQFTAKAGPVEVGLARSRSIDLLHFPLFHIVVDAPGGATLRLLVRENLSSPTLTSAPLQLAAGSRRDAAVDLNELDWRSDGGATRLPARIAVLRLRFDSAPQPILIREVGLGRPAAYARLDLNKPVRIVDGDSAIAGDRVARRLPPDVPGQRALIAAAVETQSASAPPLFVLPQHTRVEQQMSVRNALHDALPDAILLPESAFDATLQQARELAVQGLPKPKVSRQWQLDIVLALVFLIARLRPPRDARLRALVEIALVLGVPAWMIFGGSAAASLSTPQTVMVAMSVLYAISLSIPRTWAWIGPGGAWWLAAAVVGIALLLGLALHRNGAAPAGVSGMRHVARYLLWALLQQYLVCAVCTDRWRSLTGSSLAAIYLAALGFALLHTPNATLMLVTFIGGLCWCAIWLRYRALLPVALSHAVSALLLTSLLPAEILHSAEVSARFFQ